MNRALLSLLLSAALPAWADADVPACRGQRVESELVGSTFQGISTSGVVSVTFGADSMTWISRRKPEGTRLRAWSCLRDGVAMLVVSFPSTERPRRTTYENYLAIKSGQSLMLTEAVFDRRDDAFQDLMAALNGSGATGWTMLIDASSGRGQIPVGETDPLIRGTYDYSLSGVKGVAEIFDRSIDRDP